MTDVLNQPVRSDSAVPSRTEHAGLPRAAELYGKPPFYYEREDELVITYATDADAAREWIPRDLRLDDEPKALLRFVRQRYSPFGKYTGGYLSILGTWRGTRVAYMIVGAKNGFAGAAAGRELWSMPLSMCTVDMTWADDRLTARVVDVSGVEVCRCVASLTNPMDVARFGSTTVAEGLFLRQPRDAESQPTLLQTVHTAEGSQLPASAWSAEIALRLRRGSAREPWDALPDVGGKRRASYVIGGRSVLDYGHEFAI